MSPVQPPLSREEARLADDRACRLLGLPTLLLMENAGRGLAIVTEGETRRYNCRGVVVVAGRGNNGGDGLVAARHLRRRGVPVQVLLVSPADGFPPASDPGIHLRAVRALGIPLLEAPDGEALEGAARTLAPGWLLLDAVLGTGLEGPVRGHLVRVLEWMGGSGRPVVAADLPSGLDADTGEPLGPVPRCVATATFLAPKAGLLRGRGPELSGRVTVCDIGVPAEALVPPVS